MAYRLRLLTRGRLQIEAHLGLISAPATHEPHTAHGDIGGSTASAVGNPSGSVPETMPCHAQVMILTLDKEKGRVSLSTKKLEPTPGDMVRDPNLVYTRADEMAAAFR